MQVKETPKNPRPGDGTPGPGRPKGVPNKTTALLKDAILMAAEVAGGGEPDGLVNYLVVQGSEYDELNQQDLNHLSQEAVRQSLIAQILLARQVSRHADAIVMETPDKAAKILEALKGPWASATIIIPRAGRKMPRLLMAECCRRNPKLRSPLRSSRRATTVESTDEELPEFRP